jgi:hypothetical protein
MQSICCQPFEFESRDLSVEEENWNNLLDLIHEPQERELAA